MYHILDFIAGVFLLQLPIELEVLVTALNRQALHVPPVLRLLNNRSALDALERFSGAYYTACIKYIIVSGAIANSVLRALAKQGSATSITLSSPNCAPVSWGAGVMGILSALSSITLSFWYASNLRQVTFQRDSGLIWIQNAWRNAASPWKNVPSLLVAPCALCIGSILLYIVHLLSSGKCEGALGTASYFNDDVDVPLRNRLSPVPTMVQPQTMKAIVAIAVVVLWTYTVHAMRAFADLNNPIR